MHLFRSPQAEATLSADNCKRLHDAVLAKGLEAGYFTEADKQAYLTAWAQPGALTGGLNYYRAAKLSPPTLTATTLEFDYGFDEVHSQVNVPTNVPTLVIWGEQDGILTTNLNGLDHYVPQLTIRRIPDGSHWGHPRKTGVGQPIHPGLYRLS
jgi:epoxide hydrolase 4